MSDLQKEADASFAQAPLGMIARAILACNSSVDSVMILGRNGKIIAYEQSLEVNGFDSGSREQPMMFYSSGLGLLISLTLKGPALEAEIEGRVKGAFEAPPGILTE